MRVVQRIPVREEKKPQMPMWVPAWIKDAMGFKSIEEAEWFIGEDDNGKPFGGVQRIQKKEGEEGEEKGEEDGNH